MTELGTRSGSQILRTFLPQQTADLKGGIYKVTEWSSAIPISVDQDMISRKASPGDNTMGTREDR